VAVKDDERRLVFVFLKLADVMLGVKFEAKLGDQVELGFEKVDMFFLVVHQFLEQVA
jgi:hypothetical protein